MRYTLFLHYPEMTAADIGDTAIEDGKQAFHDYARALEDAGVLVSAEVLQPSANTTTLAVRDGTLRVQDGPFADAKELVGGYFLLTNTTLDEVTSLARECPNLPYGMTVEIRPVAGACHLATAIGWDTMRGRPGEA